MPSTHAESAQAVAHADRVGYHMATATKPSINGSRARLIKLIHVAKRDLALDDPTYRVILSQAGGATSTTQMGDKQLEAVLDRMKSSGFQVRKAGVKYTGPTEADKVRALWRFLHVLDLVRNPSEEALRAYVKRISRVDDLRWARQDYERLIETMKKWAMRALPTAVQTLLAQVQHLSATPARVALVCEAVGCLAHDGYDKHWQAWEALTKAIALEDGC